MEGKKIKKQLKKNEIILLGVLGALLYVAIVGKLLLMPEIEKYKEAKLNKASVQVEYDHVKMQIENIDALKKAEEAAKSALLKASMKMPPVIDRERILLSMCDYAKKNNVLIDSYAFTGQQVFPVEGFNVGVDAENAEIDPNTIEADTEVVVVCGVTMTFKSFETGLYDFLKAFEAGERSIYLKDCSVEASEDTGELSGAITMEYLAFKGKMAQYNVDLGLEPVNGKKNVFPSPTEVIRKNKAIEQQNKQEELDSLDSAKDSNKSDQKNSMDYTDSANTDN